MSVLDKVIEKYNGVHRHSIIENDVQNIYRKVFDIIEDKLFDNVTQMDNFISICLFCKQIDLVI